MLNDTRCRTAKPKANPYKLTDGKGLFLEVKPNGVKAWRYRFELGVEGIRKENMFTIGEYAYAPTGETDEEAKTRRDGRRFTLREARLEREKARALVKQGLSPVRSRQLDRIKKAHDQAITFESVAREWVALRDWEPITKKKRLDMLRRVVFPKLGALPMRQIGSLQFLDVLNTAKEHRGLSVAHEARRTMSSIFEFAVATLRADSDPGYVVRKALPANKTQHRRALSIDEIGQLFRDVGGYERNHQTVSAFRLMWFTLCRPNEAVGARWDEMDLDKGIWRISAGRMKQRKEHVVPLPRQAVELLRTLHRISGHLPHVFPHRDNRMEPMTYATLRSALNVIGWGGKYSPHATRATGSTRLNEMGFASDWIEKQLAHADTNAVRRSYNQADYLDQRTTMMQQWCDLLDAWKIVDSKVVPLRAGVA